VKPQVMIEVFNNIAARFYGLTVTEPSRPDAWLKPLGRNRDQVRLGQFWNGLTFDDSLMERPIVFPVTDYNDLPAAINALAGLITSLENRPKLIHYGVDAPADPAKQPLWFVTDKQDLAVWTGGGWVRLKIAGSYP